MFTLNKKSIIGCAALLMALAACSDNEDKPTLPVRAKRLDRNHDQNQGMTANAPCQDAQR